MPHEAFRIRRGRPAGDGAPGAASAVTSGATTAYAKRFMWHPPLFVAPLKLGGTRARRQGESGSGASVPDRPVSDLQERQASQVGRESPREVGEIPPRPRRPQHFGE